MREIMVLGKRFAGKHLNVVDGAAVPEPRGSYSYDDEVSHPLEAIYTEGGGTRRTPTLQRDCIQDGRESYR